MGIKASLLLLCSLGHVFSDRFRIISKINRTQSLALLPIFSHSRGNSFSYLFSIKFKTPVTDAEKKLFLFSLWNPDNKLRLVLWKPMRKEGEGRSRGV